jgi:hypothetical protein
MEIYMEIDSKAVYPHNKERERLDRNSNIQQICKHRLKVLRSRNKESSREGGLLRAHALWSHIHGLNPLMGEGSI